MLMYVLLSEVKESSSYERVDLSGRFKYVKLTSTTFL